MKENNNHKISDNKSRSSGVNNSTNRSSKCDKRGTSASSVASSSEWSEYISSSGKKYYYNSISEVSQWEKPKDWDPRRTSSKDSTYSSRRNRDKRSRSRSRSRSRRHESEKSSSKRSNNTSDRYRSTGNNSRDDSSHERHRSSKRTQSTHDQKDGQPQDMDISPDRSTPISENSYGPRDVADSNTVPPVVVLDNSNQTSGSLLAAALPRIVTTSTTTNNNDNGTSPPCVPPDRTQQPDPGPATPTHSENTDPHTPTPRLEHGLPRKMECLGSYSSVVGSLQHSAPMLMPSLVGHVRSDLTAHVSSWPAEILEKQANEYSLEAYRLGNLQLTRVSAELKCARSLVRHTEIQATLQEQKLMYLRQQISRLDDMKSQNSFMSEDYNTRWGASAPVAPATRTPSPPSTPASQPAAQSSAQSPAQPPALSSPQPPAPSQSNAQPPAPSSLMAPPRIIPRHH